MTMDGRILGRVALYGVAYLTLGFILLPLIFVTWLAFFAQEIPSFPPEGYSVKWFGAIANNRNFVTGFWTSLQVAVAATVIGLLIAVPASLILARRQFAGSAALSQFLLLPLVVPGVVMGTSIYVFQIETEIATGLPILGSLGGLVAGHTLLVIPWTVRLVTASLTGLDRAAEEAAQSLGANQWTTFFRVTLPAIRPGIVAGALFGFVTSFGNLEMSLFLVGPGRITLPIAILQYLEWKIDPTVAAVSVLQILLIAVAMVRASSWSWVTMTVVRPSCCCRARISSRTSRRSLASRLDRGSSRSRTSGRMTRARARATRCCWPPESWRG
ncbi:MAG: ABC polyamine/opine/phosphonate uptake family transporter inner membrane subunit [Xanthobacteraceae bacterium]|nr:MAG: ABC polyamine/opine/phosphonate uptake family transporter inner membrane subunit [Xanthobacteraceae bacterium]